jgi:hypothetical protein
MIPNGGRFVRPGVIAWDGIMAAGAGLGAGPGSCSCDVIEQAIAAAADDPERLPDLLAELARTRLWLPLPDGPGPVTDGSAVFLPVITWVPEIAPPSGPLPGGASPDDSRGETDFVPAFTSVQRLAAWADPRSMRSDPASAAGPVRSGDPAWVRDIATGMIRHVVVPFPGLAGRLPPGLGIAVNPGTGLAVRVFPDAVAVLADPRTRGAP